jgi:hypothetical protein
MFIVQILFAAGLIVAVQATQQAGWQHTESGVLILRPFEHAPYPHASRAEGYKSKETVFPVAGHYDDGTVGIFIPAEYRPGETVDFVVHFHGHGNNVAHVFEQFGLCEQMTRAGVNAILVVPQGPKDVPDSGCGKLEHDAGAMAALLDEVARFLVDERKITSSRLGHVVLCAHSGGYKVTGVVLRIGGLGDHVTDVLLFDATYGQLESFAAWCAAGGNRRLVSIFTDHLAAENFELLTLLQAGHVPFTAIMEKDLGDEQLKSRAPLFIHTTALQHNDVVSKGNYFARFVGTSGLPRSER